MHLLDCSRELGTQFITHPVRWLGFIFESRRYQKPLVIVYHSYCQGINSKLDHSDSLTFLPWDRTPTPINQGANCQLGKLVSISSDIALLR